MKFHSTYEEVDKNFSFFVPRVYQTPNSKVYIKCDIPPVSLNKKRAGARGG